MSYALNMDLRSLSGISQRGSGIWHSEDMKENNYFSHVSKKYGSLKDRLEEGHVDFQQAGENIAYNYVDGPAAVEGWLNSEGHRKALLNSDYTHLGVGFIKRW